MTASKLVLNAASGVGGAGLDVDEVFSTFLYDGNSSTQAINNGIDLSGEGGLVWFKDRNYANNHRLYDTARGVRKYLDSSSTAAEATNSGSGNSNGISAFNSNGFTIGNDGYINDSSSDFVSWTFRKAKKFFDVLQFTNSTGGDEDVSHNLGAVPAMIIGKRTDTTDNWMVWHIGTGMSNGGFTGLGLNNTGSAVFTGVQSDQGINSSTFNTGYVLSNDGSGGYSKANQLNGEYIFYLFAHNNSDGEFGPDGDQDIIKCGSFTGSSSSDVTVNVGFEPQWLLTRRTGGGNWNITDNMRGLVTGGVDPTLYADNSLAENTAADRFALTPTGFIQKSGQTGNETVIYMAIRRGPLAAPTDATKVFHVNNYSGNSNSNLYNTGFNVDMNLHRKASNTSDTFNLARLIGSNNLYTNTTGSEDSNTPKFFEPSNVLNLKDNWWGTQNDIITWSWKRAPSYFDVTTWSGTGSARTVSHNLGAVPEMIWVKSRDYAEDWNVYHSALGNEAYLKLNTTDQVVTSTNNRWNSTSPTSSVFSLGTTDGVNKNSYNYIAYLFATVAGVSKVGSFSHTYGSTTNVDCGFSSGARFVLWKRHDGSRHWEVFDTTRGLVSGNDAYLRLSDTSAESTSYDFIDPLSSGFQVGGTLGSGNFIFYAIA